MSTGEDGPRPGDAYFVPAGQGSRHRIFPGVEVCTTAGAGIMLSVVTFEPGSVVTDHSHPHEQMGVMISGRTEFTVGGLTRVLERDVSKWGAAVKASGVVAE